MKNFAIKLVWFTTIYVFVFAILCQTNAPLAVLMSLFILGYFLILLMVFTVLKDKYETSKTFKDWYEDHPRKTINEEQKHNSSRKLI
jgi:hypothetical protein